MGKGTKLQKPYAKGCIQSPGVLGLERLYGSPTLVPLPSRPDSSLESAADSDSAQARKHKGGGMGQNAKNPGSQRDADEPGFPSGGG